MDIETLQEQMNAIVEAAKVENRSLSDDEVTRYEALEADLHKAQKTLELQKRNAAYNSVTIQPHTITSGAKGDEVLERAFADYLRTGKANEDIVELRAQGEDSGATGAYLVPTTLSNRIVQRQKSFGGIKAAATNINTSSGETINIPTNDDTGNTGDRTAEHAQFSNGADLTFGQVQLPVYKYTSTGASNNPLRVSVELLQDSAFDIGGFVANALTKRIARKQAIDFAVGSGSSQPQGLFQPTADVTGTSVTYANLLNLVYSVDPEYRANGEFVIADATLKSVSALTDGNGRPLWTDMTTGIAAGRPGSLLGYGVIIDQGVNTVASGVSYAAFGDISEAYTVRTVGSVAVIVNPYSRANFGEVEYVAWQRAGGVVTNRNAYAIMKG